MAYAPIENGDMLGSIRAKLNTGLGAADTAIQANDAIFLSGLTVGGETDHSE